MVGIRTEWTQDMYRFVREWYNDKVKVDPGILANKLRISKWELINKMAEMGIRNKREHKDDN